MSDDSDKTINVNNISAVVNECIKKYNETQMGLINQKSGEVSNIIHNKMNECWLMENDIKKILGNIVDTKDLNLIYGIYKKVFEKHMQAEIERGSIVSINNDNNIINERNYCIVEMLHVLRVLNSSTVEKKNSTNKNDDNGINGKKKKDMVNLIIEEYDKGIDERYEYYCCEDLAKLLEKFVEEKVKLSGLKPSLINFIKFIIVGSMTCNVDVIQDLKLIDVYHTELHNQINIFGQYMKKEGINENFKIPNINFMKSSAIEKDMYNECKDECKDLLDKGNDYLYDYSNARLREDLYNKINFRKVYKIDLVNSLGFIQRFQKCVNESKHEINESISVLLEHAYVSFSNRIKANKNEFDDYVWDIITVVRNNVYDEFLQKIAIYSTLIGLKVDKIIIYDVLNKINELFISSEVENYKSSKLGYKQDENKQISNSDENEQMSDSDENKQMSDSDENKQYELYVPYYSSLCNLFWNLCDRYYTNIIKNRQYINKLISGDSRKDVIELNVENIYKIIENTAIITKNVKGNNIWLKNFNEICNILIKSFLNTTIKRINERLEKKEIEVDYKGILKAFCEFIGNNIDNHSGPYISDEQCKSIFKKYIEVKVKSYEDAGKCLKKEVSEEVEEKIKLYRGKFMALADIKKFYSIKSVIKLVRKENIQIFANIIRDNIKVFNSLFGSEDGKAKAYKYIVILKEMLNKPLNNIINTMIAANFEKSYRNITHAIEIIKDKVIKANEDKKDVEDKLFTKLIEEFKISIKEIYNKCVGEMRIGLVNYIIGLINNNLKNSNKNEIEIDTGTVDSINVMTSQNRIILQFLLLDREYIVDGDNTGEIALTGRNGIQIKVKFQNENIAQLSTYFTLFNYNGIINDDFTQILPNIGIEINNTINKKAKLTFKPSGKDYNNESNLMEDINGKIDLNYKCNAFIHEGMIYVYYLLNNFTISSANKNINTDLRDYLKLYHYRGFIESVRGEDVNPDKTIDNNEKDANPNKAIVSNPNEILNEAINKINDCCVGLRKKINDEKDKIDDLQLFGGLTNNIIFKFIMYILLIALMITIIVLIVKLIQNRRVENQEKERMKNIVRNDRIYVRA